MLRIRHPYPKEDIIIILITFNDIDRLSRRKITSSTQIRHTEPSR